MESRLQDGHARGVETPLCNIYVTIFLHIDMILSFCRDFGHRPRPQGTDRALPALSNK
jgi:hypothetical protein